MRLHRQLICTCNRYATRLVAESENLNHAGSHSKYNRGMTSQLRILRILRRLKTSPATVRQLADEHGVDLRTIRRDLGVIKRAGFRVLSYERTRGLKVYRVR